MKVTKDTIIGDILDINAEAAAPIFFGMGMHCLGCPASRGESVEQACMVHGVDADEIVEQLRGGRHRVSIRGDALLSGQSGVQPLRRRKRGIPTW